MSRRYLEDSESIALMDWARLTPYAGRTVADYLIHIPNGGKRNAREAARLKRMGVRAGIPDYFLHVALLETETVSQFGGLWIELKAEKGRVSEAQSEQLILLSRCGYRTGLAYGWQQAARMICEYLGIRCNVPCTSRT